MVKHDEIVYEQLKDYLGKEQFSQLSQRNVTEIKGYLSSWNNKMKYSFTRLDPDKSAGFDQAWTMAYQTRPVDQRSRNTKVKIAIIATSTKTGRFELLNFLAVPREIKSLQNASSISLKLKENERNAFEYLTDKSSVIKTRYRSTGQLYDALKGSLAHSASQIGNMESLNNVFRYSINNQYNIMEKLEELAKKTLHYELSLVISDVAKSINQEYLSWADEVVNHLEEASEYNQISVFNHIINTDDRQARSYRYTALCQYTALPTLFIDNSKLWDAIDRGESPVNLVANIKKVKPATVKRLIKNRYPFEGYCANSDAQSDTQISLLDKIDAFYWPANNEQFIYFEKMADIAICYSEAFFKTPDEVMNAWIKNNKKLRTWQGDFNWKTLLHKIIEPQIVESIVSQSNSQYEEKLDIPKIILDDPSSAVIERSISKYKMLVSNVNDMTSDIRKRLILPMVLLEFGNLDHVIPQEDKINEMVDDISELLWRNASPSEQIASSSYWHSPRVDVQRRFKSAVLNRVGQYKEWEGLLGNEPFEIEKNIFVHPLNSLTALDLESDEMTSPKAHFRFCIWSYSSSHFTQNYNMMSIRDKDGLRISSLTLKDYVDGDGKRMVKFSQNRAKDNVSPCNIGNQIADKIIKQINEGEIIPDWQSIDKGRADYKLNQVKNTIGYDFSDTDARQDVFSVYIPCLPNKVIKACERKFDNLSAILGFDQIVQSFVEEQKIADQSLIDTVDNAENRAVINRPVRNFFQRLRLG